jgi:hypothetical protein
VTTSNGLDWSIARETIGQALRDKAAWVHDRLNLAAALSVPAGEETITETLLLDLRVALGCYLEIEPFTKYQESRRTGADWEWWFCDGLGQRMYGMRVQAKKLKYKAGVPYYDLGYKPRLSTKRQVDRLISAADRDGIPALYALYNGPELDLSCFAWTCCTEPKGAHVFGVSLLSGEAALRLADSGDTSLAQAGSFSRPWSCAALCPQPLRLDEASPFWPDGPGSLSLYAADLVTDLIAQEAELRQVSTRQQALRAARGYRTWNESPSYVRELVLRAETPTDAGFERPGAVPIPRTLGGVAVFVASPEPGNSEHLQ